MKGKYLFSFRTKEKGVRKFFQVFAETYSAAVIKINTATGERDLELNDMTENYDCPKCSCQETECNYPD